MKKGVGDALGVTNMLRAEGSDLRKNTSSSVAEKEDDSSLTTLTNDTTTTATSSSIHTADDDPPAATTSASSSSSSSSTSTTAPATTTTTTAAICERLISQLSNFQINHQNSIKVQDDAFLVLGRILMNLQKHPDEARFRRLRCCNERLRSMLTDVDGGSNLLEAIGFKIVGDYWQMGEENLPAVDPLCTTFTEWTRKLEFDRFRRERDARIERERLKEKTAPDHFRKSVSRRLQQDNDRERLLEKIEADRREREAEARFSVPPSLHRAARTTVNGSHGSHGSHNGINVDLTDSSDNNSSERLIIRDASSKVADPPAKPQLVRLRSPKRQRTNSEARIATLTSEPADSLIADYERKPRAAGEAAGPLGAARPRTAAAEAGPLGPALPLSPAAGPIIVRRYSSHTPLARLAGGAAALVQSLHSPPSASQREAVRSNTVHSMQGLPPTTTTVTRWIVNNNGAYTARSSDYRTTTTATTATTNSVGGFSLPPLLSSPPSLTLSSPTPKKKTIKLTQQQQPQPLTPQPLTPQPQPTLLQSAHLNSALGHAATYQKYSSPSSAFLKQQLLLQQQSSHQSSLQTPSFSPSLTRALRGTSPRRKTARYGWPPTTTTTTPTSTYVVARVAPAVRTTTVPDEKKLVVPRTTTTTTTTIITERKPQAAFRVEGNLSRMSFGPL